MCRVPLGLHCSKALSKTLVAISYQLLFCTLFSLEEQNSLVPQGTLHWTITSWVNVHKTGLSTWRTILTHFCKQPTCIASVWLRIAWGSNSKNKRPGLVVIALDWLKWKRLPWWTLSGTSGWISSNWFLYTALSRNRTQYVSWFFMFLDPGLHLKPVASSSS